MDKPRLLDLFCGAGGAAMGYFRAGFVVYGIDNRPQPHYPFPFLQMDAMEAMDRLLRGEGLTFSNGETLYLKDFAAFHASPPCQGYTTMNNRYPDKHNSHPKLIKPIRERLIETGKPYVIENVMGAKKELIYPLKLHGGMFQLGVYRARYFETNIAVFNASGLRPENIVGVYGKKPDGRRLWGNAPHSTLKAASSLEEGVNAMGNDWMQTWEELKESIPWVYTEYMGKYLMQAIAQAQLDHNLREG